MSGATFETIAGLVHSRAGIVLGADKAYMLDTRLGGLLREEGLKGMDALAARLRAPGAERLAAAVTEALTTNESFFFRDGKPFEHLRRLLPRLAAARGPGGRIRVLSAACSTGQEAYSVAMVAESLGLLARLEVVGTDLSTEVVRRAREGVYSQFEVQRGLPVQMLVKHFRQEGGNWRIADPLRAAVRFETGNLLADLRPLGRFDVIFCRNVLIYFDAPTKTRVLAALADRLAADGVLYLGGAETVLGITERFATIEGERGVYAPVSRMSLAARERPLPTPPMKKGPGGLLRRGRRPPGPCRAARLQAAACATTGLEGESMAEVLRMVAAEGSRRT